MRRGGPLLVGAGLCLLVGCQADGSGTGETEDPSTVDQQAGSDADTEATAGSADDPGEELSSEPPPASDAEEGVVDLPDPGTMVPLAESVDRALALVDAAPPYDGLCEELASWSRLDAATADLPEPGTRADPSWAVVVGRLEYLGCGFGQTPANGASVTPPALEVVLRQPSDDRLPDLRPAQTPAGREVSVGRGPWDGWTMYVEEAWIARYHEDEAELIVVSPATVSGEPEILDYLDAALTDLTTAGG